MRLHRQPVVFELLGDKREIAPCFCIIRIQLNGRLKRRKPLMETASLRQQCA